MAELKFDIDKMMKGFIDTATKQGLFVERWIPVSERLPEEMGTYLVTLEYKEYGTVVTTLWFHNKESGWDSRVEYVVTAWMPLPKPYDQQSKGGTKDE